MDFHEVKSVQISEIRVSSDKDLGREYRRPTAAALSRTCETIVNNSGLLHRTRLSHADWELQ
jgi:hypothetical protein